jgi:hypothetical protein
MQRLPRRTDAMVVLPEDLKDPNRDLKILLFAQVGDPGRVRMPKRTGTWDGRVYRRVKFRDSGSQRCLHLTITGRVTDSSCLSQRPEFAPKPDLLLPMGRGAVQRVASRRTQVLLHGTVNGRFRRYSGICGGFALRET